jgi:hypothetical protein
MWNNTARNVDNIAYIKMDLQDGKGDMDWIELAQDSDRWRALVSAVMNVWVPQNVGSFLTSWEPVSFPKTQFHGFS